LECFVFGSAVGGLGFRLSLDPATGAQDDRQVRQDALTRENVMLRTATSRSTGSVAASAVTFWHRPGTFCLFGSAIGDLGLLAAVWMLRLARRMTVRPLRSFAFGDRFGGSGRHCGGYVTLSAD